MRNFNEIEYHNRIVTYEVINNVYYIKVFKKMGSNMPPFNWEDYLVGFAEPHDNSQL